MPYGARCIRRIGLISLEFTIRSNQSRLIAINHINFISLTKDQLCIRRIGEWGYAGSGIDHYAYSCDELALIRRIFFAGYDVYRSGGRPPESKGELMRLSSKDTIRYLDRLKESESLKFPVGSKNVFQFLALHRPSNRPWIKWPLPERTMSMGPSPPIRGSTNTSYSSFVECAIMTRLEEEAPANSVPTAAVRPGGQGFFGMTGRKGHVGGESVHIFVRVFPGGIRSLQSRDTT
nr:altered inheritance of mitochondria protein [Tanacetum cinerariifolium]